MEIEHTCESDSDQEFRSLNYGILTTPRFEYTLAITGGMGLDNAACARVLRQLEYYGIFSEDGKLIDSSHDTVKRANLSRGEVVGLILYSGPMYQLYNGIIRKFGHCGFVEVGVEPELVIVRCEKAGHWFSSSIHLIVSGVEKLRLVQSIDHGTWLYRGLSGGELPPGFWDKGFCEFAFMSTTEDLEVAMEYSGVKQGRPATVLATQASEVDKGALISEFSQFPGEKECLFTPLSYIQRQPGRDEIRDTPHGPVQIIYVKINSNGRAMTVEELQGRRKTLAVSMSETLGKEAVRYIHQMKRSPVFQARAKRDAANFGKYGEHFMASIVSGIEKRVQVFKERSSDWYLTDTRFHQAISESLKLPLLSQDKLHYWLDHEAYSCNQNLADLSMDEIGFRMLGEKKRALNAARAIGDSGLTKHLALQDCKTRSYFHESLEEVDEQGNTALTRKCAEGDDVGAILLLEAGADPKAVAIEYGKKTAIHWAAMNSMEAVVERLCLLKADVNLQDAHGQTALHFACTNQDHSMVQVLLQQNAALNLQQEDGWTALHAAASKGSTVIVKTLLHAKADVMLKNDRGRSALHAAAIEGHAIASELLAAVGVDLELEDRSEMTALHHAAWNGHSHVVNVLIAAKADIECKSKGIKSIHMAARKGATKLDTLQALIRANARVDTPENSGRTALMYAVETSGCEKVVKMLLDANASVDMNSAKTNSSQASALHMAAVRGECKIMQVLIEAKANLEVESANAKTPLLDAVIYASDSSIKSVRYLIDAKANIEARDSSGNSSMHHAESVDFIKILCSANAQVNAINHDGDTSLHLWAAQGGDSGPLMDSVKALMELKADLHMKNNDGKTVCDLARDNSHAEIVDLIQQQERGETSESQQGSVGEVA